MRMELIISTTEHVSVPREAVCSPPTSSSAKYLGGQQGVAARRMTKRDEHMGWRRADLVGTVTVRKAHIHAIRHVKVPVSQVRGQRQSSAVLRAVWLRGLRRLRRRTFRTRQELPRDWREQSHRR